MLTARSLSKSYQRRAWSWAPGRDTVRAVVDVSLAVPDRSMLMVVGASGSGKSTLARCLTGHEAPDTGDIELDGVPVTDRSNRQGRLRRRQVQLVFQDAAMNFSPTFNVRAIITEPMRFDQTAPKDMSRRCGELLEQVRLLPALMSRKAAELSGGERTRVSIARALAANPRVLILDEVTSGLDLVTRHSVMELLKSLIVNRGVSVILISHDLRVSSRFADELAVVDQGRIVEHGPAARVLNEPEHPSTRALIDAAEPAPRCW